ncbi:MAG: type II secretion system protein [Phycisphaerales bacterium JB065]
MNRRAFTLIELLVVVAVIAILISILLPSLGMARRTAQGIVGQSNLRQLQLANHAYANDHRDRFMPGAEAMSPGSGQPENLKRWHGTRQSQSEPFTPEGAPITPYLDTPACSEAVRVCPTFEPTLVEIASRPGTSAGFERACGGYGYNLDFVGTCSGPVVNGVPTRNDLMGERRSRLSAPTRTIAFADAAFAANQLIEYSFVHARFRSDYPAYRWDPSIHFRQVGERANVVWLDGHSTQESRTFTWSSGLYAANPEDYNIGWFGDHDDNRLFGEPAY